MRLVSIWLVAATLGVSSAAHADAIMPLVGKCPPPRVVTIQSHSEVCVDPAPTDCPPGWRGVVGGQCAPALCGEDASCQRGERCTEASLCMVERRRSYCYGQARDPAAAGLLAGPPMECPPGQDRYEETVSVCVSGASCEGQCKPGKLCLAPNATAASQGTRPPASAPAGTGAKAPGAGGCAGCRVGGAGPHEAAVALLLAGLGALCLRGRRR